MVLFLTMEDGVEWEWKGIKQGREKGREKQRMTKQEAGQG